MKVKVSNEQGIAHLGLIVLFVVVIAAGAFAFSRVKSNEDGSNNIDASQTEADDSDKADADITKADDTAQNNSDAQEEQEDGQNEEF